MPTTVERGAGPYDAVLAKAIAELGAEGAILIVYGDAHGGGYELHMPHEARVQVPRILREMADKIERELRGSG